MAAADVHWVSLLPELEGLIVPSKMYGILAAGRPTIFIGDPHGELAQLIRTGECGSVVQPGNGVLLAAELRRMRNDPERTAEQGRRARATFDARFTLDSAAGEWTRVLRQLGVPAAADVAPAATRADMVA
jgi:colanic acid biosynthesis glycosyl transferase WcaI